MELTPAKPAVINGENGVSQKAAGTGKASHYISSRGCSRAEPCASEDEQYQVEGAAWMDHEFSTNSMGPDQAGWDWMSVQLDDGAELMLYRMRKQDGSTDPLSAGTYVKPNGDSVHLTSRDFTMTPGGYWTSPDTGGRYPLEWRLAIPQLELSFEVTTPLDNQEIVPEQGRGPAYWEGAVDYDGDRAKGVGYLEMTGYDRNLQLGVPGAAEIQ